MSYAHERTGASARHMERAFGQGTHGEGTLRALSSRCEAFLGARPSRRPPAHGAPSGRSRGAGARSRDRAHWPAYDRRAWAPGPASTAPSARCATGSVARQTARCATTKRLPRHVPGIGLCQQRCLSAGENLQRVRRSSVGSVMTSLDSLTRAVSSAGPGILSTTIPKAHVRLEVHT